MLVGCLSNINNLSDLSFLQLVRLNFFRVWYRPCVLSLLYVVYSYLMCKGSHDIPSVVIPACKAHNIAFPRTKLKLHSAFMAQAVGKDAIVDPFTLQYYTLMHAANSLAKNVDTNCARQIAVLLLHTYKHA